MLEQVAGFYQMESIRIVFQSIHPEVVKQQI